MPLLYTGTVHKYILMLFSTGTGPVAPLHAAQRAAAGGGGACRRARSGADALLHACTAQIGQLYKIFEVLGTPSDATWAGVSAMPDWQARFPQWQRQDLAQARARSLSLRFPFYLPKPCSEASEGPPFSAP
jgi:hypothetical protein